MADRSRWDYGERDRDRYRGSRYHRGDETNRGMFGDEGEGYMRGGARESERDRHDYGRGGEYGGYGGGRDFGRDFDRNDFGRGEFADREPAERDRYGSAGREMSGRDYIAGGSWSGGNLRSDYDRDVEELAGFRGTGYLGGDYGQIRIERSGSGRDFSGGTFGQTGATERTTRQQPSYRGRGPKNYRRSDERIREDVCERLERDERVDASDLEVNVNNGVVQLSGSVADREMKRRAEDIAEGCSGVSDVENQIRVARND